MKLSNRQMEQMLVSLEGLLGYYGKFGYAIAVNYHNLSEAAAPYITMRNAFMESHDFGEPDENGLVKVAIDSPEYAEFMQGAGSILDEEADVDIRKVPPEDVPEGITASRLLSIFWMLEGV